ncbi:MAG: hypothetical protein L3J52_07360, partial [Proteobacteria bacterium]|nr:hypothetical protein [Pseudomonadota bacterium]
NGGGFGWDDVTVFELGFQWAGNKDMTYRAGYSYADQPIGEADIAFNILAPGVIKHHFTFGFTKTLQNKREWSTAIMYAPENTVTGANAFDPSQNIEISMYQWELDFSYGW